ncbi:nicotinamidase-related amidase [Bacillus oleivorans]|uniref:Nicotinamidase-related amidase n=1 Tax=Bacillus oleivorans TaxID=1448271 RepID=A0A285CKH8_9BACI|nr:cysteine hydrolase family protein [Bacillus oleivorans]SNX68050.1 nicotinamidase-related amidase [Bacillus oleivorans]
MNTALLIIDVQNGMFLEEEPVYNGDILMENVKKLISESRTNGTPIFYIQHNESEGEPLETGTYAWEIHSEIAPLQNDSIIQKTTPDSFFNTELDAELKKRGIDQLILAGIQTEICIDTTCRRAYSLGYKVTLASDAHGTWNSDPLTAEQIIQHHNRTLRFFAQVNPTSEIIAKQFV